MIQKSPPKISIPALALTFGESKFRFPRRNRAWERPNPGSRVGIAAGSVQILSPTQESVPGESQSQFRYRNPFLESQHLVAGFGNHF
jgi:hypothetical protein